MNLDRYIEKLEANLDPDLGATMVIATRDGDNINVAVHTDIRHSAWCCVRPGEIDASCNLRSDLVISKDAKPEDVAKMLSEAILTDYADLFLTVPKDAHTLDPLLKYGVNSRFLPRDAVRGMLKRLLVGDYAAALVEEINPNSSLLEEQWLIEILEGLDAE